MRNWKPILFNLLFAGNCLLLFLVIADQWLQIPAWLQVAGRMHPLLLHFPLVLLMLAVVWELLKLDRRAGDGILLAAAMTACVTAVMGMLLSKEPGYDPDNLSWHKWSGVGLSVFVLTWYIFRTAIRQMRPLFFSVSLLAVFLLIITGHQGAGITHGEDFLFAPMAVVPVKQVVSFEDAIVFDHVIKPILDEKCNGCHNPKKAKGELIMVDAAGFIKGGKNGILWDTSAKEYGLLLQRIHLPLADKKHMPPKGKPALSSEETAILYHWIRSGASTTARVHELPENDSLRLLTATLFSADGSEQYSFEAADESAVQELNSFYRVVSPVSAGSPALQASFFGAAAFSAKQLTDLLAVKQQLVSLNLHKMPVKDADLSIIAQLTELRELQLSFTGITDAGIKTLSTLVHLKQLSISGTAIGEEGLNQASKLPAIKSIYCWNTKADDKTILAVKKSVPKINIETGFTGDTISIKLNAPIVENEEQIFNDTLSLKLKHFVQGAQMYYTIDGTEPDSIHALLYKGDVQLKESVTLKAKAFKKGWNSSSVVTRVFYKKGFRPEGMEYITGPDSSYRADGLATLFDGIKADANYRNGMWLGFRKQPMEAVFTFNDETAISSLTFSALINTEGYIMPPVSVKVWGAEAGKPFKQIGSLQPKQPAKDTAVYLTAYVCALKPGKYIKLRVLVEPVPKLPAWHRGKNDRGWFFTDEVFIK